MSGFVIGFGQPDRRVIERMFQKISHRGSYLSGICEQKQTIMAQNYLRADISTGKNNVRVPVISDHNDDLSICCDAQIGNVKKLTQRCGLAGGPFSQERLLLHLYQQHGPEMFRYLNDAIFTFVVSDGDQLFAARDLLGIKTLFYGWKNSTLYLASELKSLVAVTDDVHEFPPGHYMDGTGKLTRFGKLSDVLAEIVPTSVEQASEDVRDIIQRSLENRVDFAEPTACLLSGGMDSSVIGYLASKLYKQKFGEDARLPTFVTGVGESGDIQNARLMAEHIDANHHELIVSREQVLEVLPEVVYYLESFDPSLVRSAASNFLISRYARKHGFEVLLSGEGGDEVFCGYTYLKALSLKELPEHQIKCLGYLHNNASLRLDRMNQCHSIQVIAPLISGELLNYVVRIPPEYKVRPEGNQKIEKWIFRKAFEEYLPKSIIWRAKQEFSQGSGSANFLPGYFEDVIHNDELTEAQSRFPMIRSKEELYYFRIFTEHFGADLAVKTVGQWVSL